ncbi:MAG: DUF3881 family protein [Lachnospiraceae bacterium]|nr:DUF3881 family protein [Lachnospiraceae bacterium]
MHKFMRAIGFSKYRSRKQIMELIREVVKDSDERAYTLNDDGVMLGEFCKSFAEGMGIAVCGEFDEESDKFNYDYYFPYLRGNGVTTYEDVSVERHAAKESYAGACDDINVGITLIFYVQNMIQYVKAYSCGQIPMHGTSVTMSALSTGGSIMMPIKKDEMQKKKERKDSVNRSKLIAAARRGDEDAIETLTLEDMDMYTTISRKIQKEDVFSIVDTYFMPYGVECDHYSVLGEIVACKKVQNSLTKEEIYLLTICSNELTFDVAINIIDLFGEPQVGRRFKGTIWLQGKINFPEEL